MNGTRTRNIALCGPLGIGYVELFGLEWELAFFHLSSLWYQATAKNARMKVCDFFATSSMIHGKEPYLHGRGLHVPVTVVNF